MLLWHGPLVPESQALAAESHSCVRCSSQNVKKRSVEACVTKTAKWHDCDNAVLLRWHMHWPCGPLVLLWSIASIRGHHVLDWPSSSSSEKPASIAVHADKDTACAAARDILSFKRLEANGDAMVKCRAWAS